MTVKVFLLVKRRSNASDEHHCDDGSVDEGGECIPDRFEGINTFYALTTTTRPNDALTEAPDGIGRRKYIE